MSLFLRLADRIAARKPRLQRALLLAGCIVCFAVPARALDPQRELLRFGHQSWQTDSGLPQNTVHAMVQTRDGYLWLATDGGLVRFDGVEFVVYDRRSTPELRSNAINALLEDRDGALWISTADGLVRRQGTQFTAFTAAQGLPGNSVWSVYQDHSGRLWAVTAEGLALRDGDRFRPVSAQGEAADIPADSPIAETSDGALWIAVNGTLLTVRDGHASASAAQAVGVQALCAGAAGRLWLGTRSGGLQLLQGSQRESLTRKDGLPSDEVTALLPAPGGRVWVGTASGVALVQADGPTLRVLRTIGVSGGLPGPRVQTLFSDRENSLWIGTNRGLARLTPGAAAAQSFTPAEGLSANVVVSFLEDREGSLWLGTESGGLNVLRDQKFVTLTTADGLADDLTRAVFQDHAGALWVGTGGAGLNRIEHGKVTATFTTANGLSSNIILALADDSAGNLWIGTPDGLNRLRDGRVTVYTSSEGLADDFVRSLRSAADGSLWIGTRRGLSHLVNGRFTSYSRMDGLGSDLVGALLEDTPSSPSPSAPRPSDLKPSALWIGTLAGLSRLELKGSDAHITNLTTANGLSSNVITALYLDPGGTLWIGTHDGGLNRLSHGHITAMSHSQSGLPEEILGILPDASGNLWFSSDEGVFRASLDELNRAADGGPPVMAVSYGAADGMRTREASSGGHPEAWRLADGTLAFATLRGVALIDPERARYNTVPPPVVIEQVTVDDRSLPPADSMTLPPGGGRIAFQYAGLSFVAPGKVRFRYRLEGFDRNWIDAGTSRTAYYTNIPPGRYTFRVMACNNDGVWNEQGASIRLRIQPHFYQTWTFDLLVAALLAFAGYQVYLWRVRTVEAQFKAVLAERGRIAREIHDTLAQGIVAISVQLEIVSRLLSTSIESAKEHLDQTRILVRNSLTEARSSIWDLRSQSVETDDLATRVSRLVAQATAGTGIKTQSKVRGAYRPLPARVEGELLRIAQEAVTNAVRHAACRHITVELRFDDRRLRLTVEDDGRGFSGQPHPVSTGPEGHFGLPGMRERAEQIGGSFLVESTPGEGTSVSVQLAIE